MEHSVYLLGLKKALKAKGSTYSYLAEQLKMTESGVKKMLNSKDISLRRILQICEVIDIVPSQLFNISEKSSVPTLRFTQPQEQALLKDRSLLEIYWYLAIEKRSSEQILSLKQWPSIEVKKRLQKLVSLDLATQRKDKFFPKQSGKFRWPQDSILAQTLNQEWSELVLKESLNPQFQKERMHRLMAVKLSESSYQQFCTELSKLWDETVLASQRDELSLPQEQIFNISALMSVVKAGIFEMDHSDGVANV